MTLDVRLLGPRDAGVLARVADDVFDRALEPRWRDEFLGDPRHHLAVALDDDLVVGFASAVHYVHPDRAPELWINEVGVAPSHQGRGLAKRMMTTLLAHARTLGCREAWVLTDETNTPARRLYESAGGVDAGDRVVMYEFPLEGDAPG